MNSSVFVPLTNPFVMTKFWLNPEKPTKEIPLLAPLTNTSFRRLSAATLKVICAVAGSKPERLNAARKRYSPGATLAAPGFTGPIQLESASFASHTG